MKKGQSLVELLLAIGLSSILLPALVTGLITSREGKPQRAARIQAVSLLRQTQEAVRSLRNRDWSNISENGTFHPEISGSQWASASGSIATGGFTQSYTISDVNRDTNGVIVEPPAGSLDPSTKKVNITISWDQPYASQVSSILYLTRWRENLSYIETTQTDFNAGLPNQDTVGVAVRSSNPPPDDNGEIILATGGHSDWCNPSLEENTLNLPKNGVGKAISARPGSSVGQSSQAAAGTGENASGVSYANILISDTDPPQPTIEATFDGYKTNGVFAEEDYAYLATDNNLKEFVIIDLNQIVDGKYQEVGYFDAPGNANGGSIFVSGNVGYLTAGNQLYAIDLSSKSGSLPLLTSVTLAGSGNKVVVNGDYAYVAVNSEPTPLQIVKIENGGQTLTVVGYADLPDDEDGEDVVVNTTGTRAYLIIEENKKFYIVDTSTKNGSQPFIGSYSTGEMMPKGIAVVPGNRAIVVGSGGIEYQVVNISNESAPASCIPGGGIDLNFSVNGVSSIIESDGDVYSYIISDSDPEFRIVSGGSGGAFTSEGIFESQTFNPGYQTADNRFSVNFSQPAGTAIQFQVALANLDAGLCPSSFTFVGEDGTSASWFPLTPTPGISTYSAPFPLGTYGTNYSNPGQCFRYKVKLSTTDQNNTPVLYDFTINYSP